MNRFFVSLTCFGALFLTTACGDDPEPDPACGDNTLDMGEVCDDGNNTSGDGCSATCDSDETCGNDVVDNATGETCDDGNTESGDGCQANCALPTCGDGTIDSGEACDDGNTTDGDGCSATCMSDESCANGIVDSAVGEICDDSNAVDGDGCSADCSSDESCGNGIMDTSVGEICDDGNVAGGDGCASNCLSNESCGNGIVDTDAGEVCDDSNVDDGDGCSASCLSDETCGNGIMDTFVGEVCDDSNVLDGDGCSASCLSDETCGNGVLDSSIGEVCDDTNLVDGDGCSANCLSDETCGNGIMDSSVGEVCDDTNVLDGDGCSASCLSDETCGNNIVDTAVGESCDDGGTLAGDGCDEVCVNEFCARVTNTAAEDLTDVDWLDNCVNAVGQNVQITLRDDLGAIVYQESGVKNGDWDDVNRITSTAAAGNQYDKISHDRIITLGNGDLLMITGKNAQNGGCGGSMGNGYGIVIHDPVSSQYFDSIKVMIEPYLHTVGGTSPRNFGGWTEAFEISFADEAVMQSCFPFFGTGPGLTSFLGDMEMNVF